MVVKDSRDGSTPVDLPLDKARFFFVVFVFFCLAWRNVSRRGG